MSFLLFCAVLGALMYVVVADPMYIYYGGREGSSLHRASKTRAPPLYDETNEPHVELGTWSWLTL